MSKDPKDDEPGFDLDEFLNFSGLISWFTLELFQSSSFSFRHINQKQPQRNANEINGAKIIHVKENNQLHRSNHNISIFFYKKEIVFPSTPRLVRE